MTSRFVICAVAQLLLPTMSAASPPATEAANADQACARLTHAARALRLAGPSTRGRYHCERQRGEPRHFVFALRYQGAEVAEGASSLVGYYLVDRRSGAIHEWDMAEGPRGALLPGYGIGR